MSDATRHTTGSAAVRHVVGIHEVVRARWIEELDEVFAATEHVHDDEAADRHDIG
jgi:hypothetical protein